MTQKKSTKSLAPKWLRVIIPSLLIVIWLAAASIGGPYFGKISEVASNDQSTFLPASAESTRVNDELKKFRDSGTIPAIFVFTKGDQTLTDKQLDEIKDSTAKLTENSAVKGEISPPVLSDDKKAALVIVNIESGVEYKEVIPELRNTLDTGSIDVTYKITGPVGFLEDLSRAFAGIDGLLLLVALGVVFIILLIVYRSPFLPFVVLLTALSALAAAILVVWHLADANIVQINGQVQGILFILVIGAATDYSLLYIARYREELERHERSWQATTTALKRSVEPILAAGGTVSIGLLCLLLSDLNSNKALGPVGAIGIALAVLSALTFLPAMLVAFGRRVFWPRTPHYHKTTSTKVAVPKSGIWVRIADFVGRHPRRIWIVTSLVLIACLAGLPTLKSDGIAQSEFVLGKSEARDGQQILDKHFPSGSGTPLQVIVSKDKIDDVVTTLDEDKGVASVAVTSGNSPSGTIPTGRSETELKQEIFTKVQDQTNAQKAALRTQLESQMAGVPTEAINMAYEQAASNIPAPETIAEKAYPFKNATPKIVDDKALLQVTLTDNGDSKAAQETVARLREETRKVDGSVLIGGTSATQLDANLAAEHDRAVVIPTVLVVITIILMLLLRSILAPIILLLTTILSFAATLGIAALPFEHVWRFPGSDPAVVLYAFVFLVALGIDYNIFLMTRVREESRKLGTRKGVMLGLIVTGGVITSAGIVLAATFAALAVIPVLFLVQIAFIVAFGVLIDTTIVRSLLVPSLIYSLGKRAWWPSKKFKD